MLGKIISSLPLGQRLLMIYSGVLTTAVCAAVLCGFVSTPEKARFKELEVQRIDVVEPDGTLRMVIHNKALHPQAIFRGKEYTHPNPSQRQGAGLLFFNDEGTENGGLTFGGHKGPDGKIHAGGSLTFDKYEQDQVVQLMGGQDGDEEKSALLFSDRPDHPLMDDLEEMARINALPADQRAKAIAGMDRRKFGATRIAIGRQGGGLAALAISDAKGRPRMVLSVTGDGDSRIKFLDANGKVVNEIAPKAPGNDVKN